MMDKLFERSPQALDPVRHTGRDDSAGDNDTFSRPPEDLGGALRYTLAQQATVSRSYDSYASSGPAISLLPGNAWQIR